MNLVSKPRKVKAIDTIHFGVTTYSSVTGQCDGNPKQTASGYVIQTDSDRICAVPRALIQSGLLKYGDTLIVSNCEGLNGLWIIKDVTNARIFKWIDIHIPKHSKYHNLLHNALITHTHYDKFD